MTITTIAQVTACLRDLLGPEADRIARETGLVQRESKLMGAEFVQCLTFGWLGNAAATRDELAESAADLGVSITSAGLVQRMTRSGAACLRQVLEAAAQKAVASDPLAIPILQRFAGVELQDSTVISLPDELADVWAGGSGPAALKVQTRWDFVSGRLQVDLRPGREHDQRAPRHDDELPAGALRITDLGYFHLERLQHEAQRGVYWLVRLRIQTLFTVAPDCARALHLDPTRAQWTVLDLLQHPGCDAQTHRPEGLDLPIELGARHGLPCRLLIQCVPPAIAAQRRQRLRDEAQRKAQPLSESQMRLADWTIFVTNLRLEQLALHEALVLYRVRWQIELLFRLWKTYGQVDEWRSHKPSAILCEVYAKLLGMLIQHWLILVCGFSFANRSLVKAARAVRTRAAELASALDDPQEFQCVLERIRRRLARGCRMNPRAKHPNLYQLLLALQPLEPAPAA